MRGKRLSAEKRFHLALTESPPPPLLWAECYWERSHFCNERLPASGWHLHLSAFPASFVDSEHRCRVDVRKEGRKKWQEWTSQRREQVLMNRDRMDRLTMTHHSPTPTKMTPHFFYFVTREKQMGTGLLYLNYPNRWHSIFCWEGGQVTDDLSTQSLIGDDMASCSLIKGKQNRRISVTYLWPSVPLKQGY